MRAQNARMSAPPHAGPRDRCTDLETVDAVARAAHLWVRNLYMTECSSPEERQAVAGGLVDGLCERLDLGPEIRDLVAYVYTMLDGQTSMTLAVARLMLAREGSDTYRQAYRRGRLEAAGIIEMLACHRNG